MATHELIADRVSALAGVPPAIRAALGRIRLPMAILDLDGWRVLAANAAIDRLLVGEGKTSAGRSIEEFLARVPDELRSLARGQLADLASGRLLGYEAIRHFKLADGSEPSVHWWFRRLDLTPGRGLATVVLIPTGPSPADGAPAPFVLAQASSMAIAVADHEWRIQNVSSDIRSVLGYEPTGFTAKPLLGLVHPSDAPNFMVSVTQALGARRTIVARARMRAAKEEWRETVCYVSPLCEHEPPRLGLILTAGGASAPDLGPAARMSDLEQHLWRIGLDVRAAGFLPEVPRYLSSAAQPELAELSSRQWEIVSRLLRGERVEHIADAMFLSRSTVRNHLSAVYRKFAVHSQAALLAKLRQAGFPAERLPAAS